MQLAEQERRARRTEGRARKEETGRRMVTLIVETHMLTGPAKKTAQRTRTRDKERRLCTRARSAEKERRCKREGQEQEGRRRMVIGVVH